MNVFEKLVETSAHTAVVEIGLDGVIGRVNRAFARHVEVPPEELVGQELSGFLAARDRDRVRSWTQGEPLPDEPTWINFTTRDGTPLTLRSVIGRMDETLRIVGEPEFDEERSAAEELMRLNNELATMARERARRERELERLGSELEATLEDLRTSYWHLQKIQEFIPICMECGKVKTDEARWQVIVDYLKDNEIFVSHGYCPDCGQAKMTEWGLE